MSLAEHCSPLTAPNTWKKTESTLRQIWGQQDKDKGQDSEVGGQWLMQCKWGAAQSVLCHQTKHFTNPLTNGCLLKHVLTALVDSGMSVPGRPALGGPASGIQCYLQCSDSSLRCWWMREDVELTAIKLRAEPAACGTVGYAIVKMILTFFRFC